MHTKFFLATLLSLLLYGLGNGCVSVRAQSLSPQVTEQHKILQHEVGTWIAEVNTWTAANTEPVVSQGTEVNHMLGELWVVGVFESKSESSSFRGQSQVGYDPVSQKIIGTWIDTSSPHLNVFEGTIVGNQLIMRTKGPDPKTGESSLTKMVTTYVDRDHKTYESFEPVPGKKDEWWKTMEVKYTRKK